MEPIVNLDETIGKMVGKIQQHTLSQAQDHMVRQFLGMGLKLPYPKGVYRFKTFEEADAWEWKHMMEAAKKKLQAQGIQVEPAAAEDPLTRGWRRLKAWWKKTE